MNRRKLLQMTAAAAGMGWLGGATAQDSPAGSPIATSAPSLPVLYGDVSQQYEALTAQLLELGRSATRELVESDTDALYGRFSQQMRTAVPKSDLVQLLEPFTTNQAHFEATAAALVFDAQMAEGAVLTGFVQRDSVYPFQASRSYGLENNVPAAASPAATGELSGVWQGTIDMLDGRPLHPTIRLEISPDQTRGAVTIPEWGLSGVPLSAISFRAAQPLGERIADRALPRSPDMRFYWARYEWGGRGMIVRLVFDETDMIVGALVSPEWQLPVDPAAGWPPLPALQLPFDGLWWVYWGGDSVPENYHALVPSQRYAIDLMIWNDGATFHDDASINENYWVWGQPVLAPADGVVVTVVDGIEANVPGQLPVNPVDSAGNHVVLRVREDAYLFLAHLQAGSIAVSTGDSVLAGTQIGRVGNTGRSSEPHLHLHVQTDPALDSISSVGLPVAFVNAWVNGTVVPTSSLRQGEFVVQG